MAESAAAALGRLEGEGRAVCLTVGTDTGPIRVQVVAGAPVHAEADGLVILGIVFYLAIHSRG